MSSVKLSTIGATHIAEAVLQVCKFTGLGTCSASTSQCSTVTSRCGSRPSDMFKLHPALCKYPVQALLYHDPDTLSNSLRLYAKCRWTTDTWSSFRQVPSTILGFLRARCQRRCATISACCTSSTQYLHAAYIVMHSLCFTHDCVVSCRSYRFCPQTTTHSWSWLTTSAAMPSQAR